MKERIVWLNGVFVPESGAKISIFDRGLLFADAVYEGLGVLEGQIVDFAYHMQRLHRSLAELRFDPPMAEDDMHTVLLELAVRNNVKEGFIYLHITRGVHDRDYLYPKGLTPNMFAFTQPQHGPGADDAPQALKLASTPDLRWLRRDIKTSNLLGQVLAKVAAEAEGADEALMTDPDGYVTEAGAMSFFPVKDGVISVRLLKRDLLPGVTRRTMLDVANTLGLRISERRYRIEDACAADEAFVTGASSYVQPVSHINGQPIGDGRIGPFTRQLREAYLKEIRARMGKV